MAIQQDTSYRGEPQGQNGWFWGVHIENCRSILFADINDRLAALTINIAAFSCEEVETFLSSLEVATQDLRVWQRSKYGEEHGGA